MSSSSIVTTTNDPTVFHPDYAKTGMVTTDATSMNNIGMALNNVSAALNEMRLERQLYGNSHRFPVHSTLGNALAITETLLFLGTLFFIVNFTPSLPGVGTTDGTIQSLINTTAILFVALVCALIGISLSGYDYKSIFGLRNVHRAVWPKWLASFFLATSGILLIVALSILFHDIVCISLTYSENCMDAANGTIAVISVLTFIGLALNLMLAARSRLSRNHTAKAAYAPGYVNQPGMVHTTGVAAPHHTTTVTTHHV